MSAWKYLSICLGLPLVVLTMVGAINFIADPIGIYHYGKPWDWTHSRNGITLFLNMHKTHEVQNYEPDALILGNSRAVHSLDPAYSAFPPKTYNFGTSAANMYVCWRNLQQAADVHMPKLVVLAIDERMFDALSIPTVEFSEDRLSVSPTGRHNYFSCLSDVGASLLSFKALTLSLKSLAGRGGPDAPFRQGFQADEMVAEEQMNLTSHVYTATHQFVVPYRSDFLDKNGNAPQMNAFGHILAFCAQNSIHLAIFVNPLHSVMIDSNTEDWNKYGTWMTATVDEMKSFPNPQCELWDFTSYNNMSTEKFPPTSEKYSNMVYYWEGSHYRTNVGDMVLARILTGQGPANFGQRVTPDNVQADLDRIKAEKEAWHQSGQVVLIGSAPANPVEPTSRVAK